MGKLFTVAKFLDQFLLHLRKLHGVNNVALSYIIRDQEVIPAVLPPLMPLVLWSAGHTSMMDELISFGPHKDLAYKYDNAIVYAYLS